MFYRKILLRDDDFVEIYEESILRRRFPVVFGRRNDFRTGANPTSHGQLLSMYGRTPSLQMQFHRNSKDSLVAAVFEYALTVDYVVVRSKKIHRRD